MANQDIPVIKSKEAEIEEMREVIAEAAVLLVSWLLYVGGGEEIAPPMEDSIAFLRRHS